MPDAVALIVVFIYLIAVLGFYCTVLVYTGKNRRV